MSYILFISLVLIYEVNEVKCQVFQNQTQPQSPTMILLSALLSGVATQKEYIQTWMKSSRLSYLFF